jgi:hypothetical protein
MHIIETPCIWLFLPDRMNSETTISAERPKPIKRWILPIWNCTIRTIVEGGRCPGTAGVFPLGFTWKGEAKLLGYAGSHDRIEGFRNRGCIFPRNIVHWVSFFS